jgi:hypothetical protein
MLSYLWDGKEATVPNSDYPHGEDWGDYKVLLEKGGSQILKDAFEAAEDLAPDQGKYLGMREIMMALIVITAENDRRKK